MFVQKFDQKQKVTEIINEILRRGIDAQASDIHLEPYIDATEERIIIRFRVDGILGDVEKIVGTKADLGAIINAVKIMANLDPTNKRVNQDSRFNFSHQSIEYDIRVSTMPTILGEKVVMRITEKNSYCMPLSQLGMTGETLELFHFLVHQPEGFVLISGPSGSGKTTTLYSILNNLYRREINICTVEDPVEVKFLGINQIQVEHEFGMTFVSGLRAVMRQDPNIIAVGEIRDVETLRVAFQASLAGLMVFSTIHAKDAVNTLIRLLNMGVEPFFISTALTSVVSQRLIRLICNMCKGRGCNLCINTGFKKRMGIFEVLKINDAIRQLILRRSSVDELKAAALREGMVPFTTIIEPLLKNGLTTKEEVDRVLALE